MNKTLKFHPHLVPLVLAGEKTITWRVADEKNLTVGDVVDFLDSVTKKHFATGRLVKVVEKTFGELKPEDKAGHEEFSSEEEMYKYYSETYNTAVTLSTKLKIIWFELLN